MKQVIYNSIIPFKGFKAIALLPFIFVRNEAKNRFGDSDERHERIHLHQQYELLVVGIVITVTLAFCCCGWWSLLAMPLFLWWYGVEWLVRFATCGNTHSAYRNISFEQEAFLNECDHSYLYERKPFAWVKYLTKRTYRK